MTLMGRTTADATPHLHTPTKYLIRGHPRLPRYPRFPESGGTHRTGAEGDVVAGSWLVAGSRTRVPRYTIEAPVFGDKIAD